MEYQNETLSMIYYRSKSFHQNVDNKPMKIILDCENIHKAKYVMYLGIFRVLFVIGFSFGAALCKPLIGWVWNSTVNFIPFSTWTSGKVKVLNVIEQFTLSSFLNSSLFSTLSEQFKDE